jgi:molybdenum cofactor cytidylyltransferase
MNADERTLAAMILAAGLSSRMGDHKILLAWSDGRTVIEQIITQVQAAQIDPIYVVIGHRADEVHAKVTPFGVQTVYNPEYAVGELLSSLKAGLRALPAEINGVMVILGDQPGIQPGVIRQVAAAFISGQGEIIAARYNGERGHPIVIHRRYWDELLALPSTSAPRDVINRHKEALVFVDVIGQMPLADIDTPEDYVREREAQQKMTATQPETEFPST